MIANCVDYDQFVLRKSAICALGLHQANLSNSNLKLGFGRLAVAGQIVGCR